jgi:phosphopentomutase
MVLVGSLGWASSKQKQSAFGNQSKPEKATVTILALSSSSRQTFAGDQEIYLADLEIKGEHQFVRLIDQYPGFGLPIELSLIKNRTVFKLLVTREPECDVPGAQIYLRKGESEVFNGSVRDSLASRQTEAVPCYKTLHQTITVVAKK